MKATVLRFLLTSVYLSLLFGCDENDRNKYSFHAYNMSQQTVATGTFHMYFNDGLVTGTFDVIPADYFGSYSSDVITGNYTDSTVYINCSGQASDRGKGLYGTFEGSKIVGTVIQSALVGDYQAGTFVLKH